jgi:hypothetical protein
MSKTKNGLATYYQDPAEPRRTTMRSAVDINRAARRAGLPYLAAAILAMIGYFYLRPRFFVSGDAAATARNILANEQLYRLGILTDVVGQLLFIVAVLALYRLFEDVDRNQARLMAALIGTSIAVQFAGFTLNVAPLVLLSENEYLPAFTRPQLDALAYASLSLSSKLGELVMSMWGLWLFPFAALTLKSGFFPKFVGVLLILAGAAYVLAHVIAILFPARLETFNQVAFPIYFGELIVILWLAFIGANPRRAVA